MNRELKPELLDELPPTDPAAVQSRRDLRRINALMRNAHYLAQFLNANACGPFVEIGAGDGHLAFEVARRLRKRAHAILLDRQLAITDGTIDEFRQIGWTCEVVQADVFEWLLENPKAEAIIANLFVHHFENQGLATLISGLANAANVFAACEPWRNRFAPFFAKNVWAIGCNDVTCHDAEISVRAGFREKELSALWPRDPAWKIVEHRAGLFSHFFGAVRKP